MSASHLSSQPGDVTVVGLNDKEISLGYSETVGMFSASYETVTNIQQDTLEYKYPVCS